MAIENAPRTKLDLYYAQPAVMTSGGAHATLFNELPGDAGALAAVVQGLVLHEFVASSFYGVEIPEERKRESHIRSVERMLDQIQALDDQPLSVARRPDKRLVGVCHHFVLLLVAMLRAKGVPARMRFGFGSYFNPPYFEEHQVCECWNAAGARWVLVDPQFDEVWRRQMKDHLKMEHDILDVPRDRFLIAGDAWAQCRAGRADASKFGILKGDLRGLWFIAGELVRDGAALNKVETLPWDVWGAMPQPNETLQPDQVAFFDRLAALTRTPDTSFDELRTLYDRDDRLRVPSTVFNAQLNRPEEL
jgi:hypothetical protein